MSWVVERQSLYGRLLVKSSHSYYDSLSHQTFLASLDTVDQRRVFQE